MAENETPAQQPGTAVEQITAKAKKKRKHQEFLRQLHALPHDFRTRLNSSELRDVGKEFIKAQNKQLKNADHRSYGLNPTEFEQVMGALGFEDLPMMKRVFGIFDLNGDGEVDYHELVCCPATLAALHVVSELAAHALSLPRLRCPRWHQAACCAWVQEGSHGLQRICP